MKLCDYGCGKQAVHKFKNGKFCCSKSLNKCLAMRKKNSIGGTGKNKHRFYELVPNENILCHYGCGKIARYMAGQGNLKPCCSKYYSQCSFVRRKNTKSNTGKIQPKGKESKLFGRKRPDQSKFMVLNNPMYDEVVIDKHKSTIASVEYKNNMSSIVKERWANKEYREQYRKSMEEKGLWTKHTDLDKLEDYRALVKRYTSRSIYEHYYEINSDNKNIGITDYHVDHIYSIVDGFRNGVDPKIIGSHINLQILSARENIKKYSNSWILKEDLLRIYKEYEDSI